MRGFTDTHRILHVGSIPVPDIVRHTGTPVYIYDLDEVTRRVHAYQHAFPDALLAYACKANANPALLSHLARLGCGADVVSGYELQRALAAGIPPNKIVVNGNAKSRWEIELAVQVQVRAINLDAPEEVERVARVAEAMGHPASVALRINPGLDPATHPHLKVGAPGSHFGIPPEDVIPTARAVMEHPSLNLRGIHIHAGSLFLRLEDVEAVAAVAVNWVRRLRSAGIPVHEMNLGGGLGIDYEGRSTLTPEHVATRWAPHLEGLDVTLVVEPGRWLVAPAGILVVQVVQVKRAWGRTFVAVDGGMNALLRPALYGARHRIVPVQADEETHRVDVVGPNCESADVLGRDYLLPPLQEGDLLAILDVGAYGRSMANTYNARPLPPEVVVEQGRWRWA